MGRGVSAFENGVLWAVWTAWARKAIRHRVLRVGWFAPWFEAGGKQRKANRDKHLERGGRKRVRIRKRTGGQAASGTRPRIGGVGTAGETGTRKVR